MIYLDDNGVTIKVKKGAVIGQCYMLNGIEYRVVEDEWELAAILDSGGDLSKVVTSFVTKLSYLAYSIKGDFNQDISSWDVSKVTSMLGLFAGAKKFNQNIGFWDVSKVRTMQEMFKGASSFDQPIGNWNTKNVVTFISMFEDAKSFNQPIGDWNVSKAANMMYMFKGAKSFNQPIGDWDVSNANKMSHFFSGATAFNQDISNWDVSNTSINCFFEDASSFNQNINNWKVSGSVNRLFKGASSFNQPLDKWDYNKFGSITEMFRGASSFNQDLRPWAGNNKLKDPEVNVFKDANAFTDEFSPFEKTIKIRKKPIKVETGIELNLDEKNTFSKIKKLLVERDFNKIDLGIELLVSLNNEKLFETLLFGCKISDSDLIRNTFFKGSKPAQPYLNYALFCVIAHCPDNARIDISLVQKTMEYLDLNLFFSTNDLPSKFIPIDKFSSLSKLIIDLSIFRGDYNKVDNSINRENWFINNKINELEILNACGSLIWFKNFSHLKSLKFSFSYYSVSEIESFEHLINLDSLYLFEISNLKNVSNNIDFLYKCKSIKIFHLNDTYKLEIENIDVIKNFNELQELHINNIDENLNLEALLFCKNLKTIYLDAKNYSNYNIDYNIFKNCFSLESLVLNGFDNLDVYGEIIEIEGIQNLNKLKCVSLKNFNFFDLNYKNLIKSSELETVLYTINDKKNNTTSQDNHIHENKTISNIEIDVDVELPSLTSEDLEELNKIKKLLVERDFDKIDLGIDLLISSNNAKLFEFLLFGCNISDSGLNSNDFFYGNAQSKRFLNYALFCIIANVPDNAQTHQSIDRNKIKSLDLNTFFSNNDLPNKSIPIEKFTTLSTLKIDFEIFLDINNSDNNFINIENWFIDNKINELYILNIGGRLEWLKNFKYLESLKYFAGNYLVDIESFKYLENLEELYLYSIKKNSNLNFLVNSKKIKKFHLGMQRNSWRDESELENIDIISNFKELEELTINGISNKVEFNSLLSCINLKALKLGFDSWNSNFDYNLLANCKSLEFLDLVGISKPRLIGKVKNDHLKVLKKLNKIIFNNVEITTKDGSLFIH